MTHASRFAPVLGAFLAVLTLFTSGFDQAQAQTYTWNGGSAANGNWSTAGNWIGTPPPAGGSSTDALLFIANLNNNVSNNNLAGTYILNSANFALGLPGFSVTGNDLQFDGANAVLNLGAAFSGSGIFSSAVTISNNITFNTVTTINNNVAAASPTAAPLTLSGNLTFTSDLIMNQGRYVFSGTNSGAGRVIVNGGAVLTLDFVANNTAKIGSGGVALAGGFLIVGTPGNAGATTYDLNGLTLNAGFSALTFSSPNANNTLALGAITRNEGAFINFVGSAAATGFQTTTTANTNGILGGSLIIGFGNWASVNGSAQIIALAAGGYVIAGAATLGTANDGTENITLNGGTSGTTGNQLVNSLRFQTAAHAISLQNGTSLTITSGGIMGNVNGAQTIQAASGSATIISGYTPPGGLRPEIIYSNFGNTGMTIAASVTFQSNTSLTVLTTQSSLTLASSNTLFNLNVIGGTLALGTTTQTVSGNLIIKDGSLITGTAGPNLNVAGGITLGGTGTTTAIIGGAPASFDKLNSATATLSGLNTFVLTGATPAINLNSGILSINLLTTRGVAQPLGGNTNATINLGSSFTPATLQITATSTSNWPIVIGSAGGTLDITSGTTILNGAANQISGGPLTKTGAGVLQLNQANNFGSSTTTVDLLNGQVNVGDAVALGSNIINFAGVPLYGPGAGRLASSLAPVTNSISPLVVANNFSGIPTVGGTNAFTLSGTFAMTGNSVIYTNNTGTSGLGAANVPYAAGTNFSGVISGAFSLSTNAGVTGNLALSGNNTFGGVGKSFTFNGQATATSILTLGVANAFGNSSNTFIWNGGSLAGLGAFTLNPYAQQWNGGQLGFAGNINLDLGVGPITLGTNINLFSNNTATFSTTIGGVIGGAGKSINVLPAGTGTLVLNGANTFGGVGSSFTFNAPGTGGTLVVGNAAAFGNVNNNVILNGGTLTSNASIVLNNYAVQLNGNLIYSGTGSNTLNLGNGPVTMGFVVGTAVPTTLTLTINDTSTSGLTIGGGIGTSTAGGPTNLTIAGVTAGVLTIGGNSTYTGITTINGTTAGTTVTVTGSMASSLYNVGIGTLVIGAVNALPTNAVINLTGSAITGLTVNANQTIGGLSLQAGAIVNGSATLGITNGTFDLRNGTVNAPLGGIGGGVAKTTTNTVTLFGANTFTGASTISLGTLTLNYTTVNGTKLSSTAPLNIAGASFVITGSATAPTVQAVGGLNLLGGNSIISLTAGGSQTVVLNVGAISRPNAGAVLNPTIGANTVINTSTSNTNGILGGYAFTGNNWLTVNSSNNLVALGTYATATATALGTANTDNSRIGPGISPALAVDTVINSILYNGNNNAQTLDISGNTLTVTSGGIMNGTNFAFTINNGNLTTDTSPDLVFIINGNVTSPITVNARIVDSAGHPVAVTRGGVGAGTLALNANNTYTGGTFLTIGTLTASGPDNATSTALGTGAVRLFQGTTLNLRNSGTGSSGTISFGNNLILDPTIQAATVSVDRNTGTNTGNTIQLGSLQLGNAVSAIGQTLTVTGGNGYNLQFTGPTTLVGNATIAATTNNPNVILTGPITDNGNGYTLTNASTAAGGILFLNGSNNFTGGYINASGNVTLGSLGAFNASTPVPVTLTAGILSLGGNSVTVSGLSGGATINNGASSASLTVNQASAVQTIGTGAFTGTLTDGSGGSFSLVKDGPALLSLATGANTYSGTTTVLAGQLAINTAVSFSPNSSVAIGDNGNPANALAAVLSTGATGTHANAVNARAATGLVVLAATGGTATYSGAITLNNNLRIATTGGNITIGLAAGGAIGGTGFGLVKTSTSLIFTLAGTSANTFTGTTVVKQGTLTLGKTGGTVAAIGGDLVIGNGFAYGGTVNYASTATTQLASGGNVTLNPLAAFTTVTANTAETIGTLTLNAGVASNGFTYNLPTFVAQIAGTTYTVASLVNNGGTITFGNATTTTTLNLGGATLTGGTVQSSGGSTLNAVNLTGNITSNASSVTANFFTNSGTPNSLNLGSSIRTITAAQGTVLNGVDLVVGSNVITGSGGGFTLNGPGVVQLPSISAVGSYTGGVTLNSGTLYGAGANAVWQPGLGTLRLNGGTFATNGGNTVPVATAVTITNNSGVVTFGTAPNVIPNATRNNYYGMFGNLNPNGAMTLAGAVTFASNPTINVINPSNMTISGAITAADGFTVSGGVNLANASLTLGSSLITVTSTAGIAAGNYVVGAFIPNNTTVGQVISPTQFTLNTTALATASGQSLTANAFLTLSGNNSTGLTGGLNINNGLITFSADNQLGSATNAVNFSNGGVLDFNTNANIIFTRPFSFGTAGGVLYVRQGTLAFATAGQLTGSGTLTKTGFAAMTVSAANAAFAGSVIINGGTFTASIAGALNAAPVTVNAGGLFLYSAATATTGVITVNSGGQVLWGQAKVAGEATPVINGGGVIRGLTATLGSFTAGTNITLAPGAIISNSTGGANGTIAGLGTTPLYYFGLGSSGNPTLSIGDGTPFLGIAGGDRAQAIGYSGNTASLTFNYSLANGITRPTFLSVNQDFALQSTNVNWLTVAGVGAPPAVTVNIAAVPTGLFSSGTVRLDTATVYAGIDRYNVLAGATLRTNITNALANNATIESGGYLFTNIATGFTGVGIVTLNPGAIVRINSAGGLTGTQVTPAMITGGVILRHEVSGDITGINKIGADAIVELAGGSAALTNGGTLTINGGTITNDANNRNVNSGNNPILVGPNGLTLAATTGTLLQFFNAIGSVDPAGSINIGTTAQAINGLTKQGLVEFSPASSPQGTKINVLPGATLFTSAPNNSTNVLFTSDVTFTNAAFVLNGVNATIAATQTWTFTGNNNIYQQNGPFVHLGTVVNNGGILTFAQSGGGTTIGFGAQTLGVSNPDLTGTLVFTNIGGISPSVTANSGSTIAGKGALGTADIVLTGATLSLRADAGEVFGNNITTNGVVGLFYAARTANALPIYTIAMGTLTVATDTVINATNGNFTNISFTQTNLNGNLVVNATSGTTTQFFHPGALNDGAAARSVTATGIGIITLDTAATSFGSTSSWVVNNGTTNLNALNVLGTGALVINSGTVNANVQNALAGISSITLNDEIATLFLNSNQTTNASLTVSPATGIYAGGNINTNGYILSVGSANIAAGGQVNALASANGPGGFVVTNGLLTGGGAIAGATTIAGTATVGGAINIVGNLAYNTSGNSSYGGLLNGVTSTVTLSPTNTGALSLSGANTYGGGTTVNGGILAVNSTTGSGTGRGSVVVNNTGTLRGNNTLAGAIAGPVTVNSGGAIRGTANNGTLFINNNVTLTQNAILQTEVSTDAAPVFSQLRILGSGLLNLNPGTGPGQTFTINLVNNMADPIYNGSVGPMGSYTVTLAQTASANQILLNGTLLMANDTLDPTKYVVTTSGFAGLTNTSVFIDNTGTMLQMSFTPSPEPHHILLVCVGVLFIGMTIRRRMKLMAA